MLRRLLPLLLGVFACSTSVIFIRLSATDPFVLCALRLAISSVVLAPLFLAEFRRHRAAFSWTHLRRTHLPALVLSLHLLCWTVGARMTAAAQASLIVNLVPIAIPFFLVWIARERINRREVAGTAIAILGVLALSVRDAMNGNGSAAGNAVCFVSMLLFSFYLALGRRNRDFPSVWLYVIPIYAQAALFCGLAAWPRFGGFNARSGREWALMAALAAIPTLCGHSLLNAAMRQIRGQIVGLCNVGQFIFAGALGYLLFNEVPRPAFYAMSAVVVAGVALAALATPEAGTPAGPR